MLREREGVSSFCRPLRHSGPEKRTAVCSHPEGGDAVSEAVKGITREKMLRTML